MPEKSKPFHQSGHDRPAPSSATGCTSEEAKKESRTFLIAHTLQKLEALLASPLQAGLYLIATPIGNLGDISLRALTSLHLADRIYCEDTRHSRKLLSQYGINTSLSSYHDHNAKKMDPLIINQLQKGESIALISDAGMPLISDPGYTLVRAVRTHNLPVTLIPGPNAALSALSLSGLPSDRFFFEGFLPAKKIARQKRLENLRSQSVTLIFYESPYRLVACLKDLYDVFGNREIVLARELTKKFEEVWSGNLDEANQVWQDSPARGEFVLIVSASQNRKKQEMIPDSEISASLQEHMENMSLKDAVTLTSQSYNLPKKHVYSLALALKKQAKQ